MIDPTIDQYLNGKIYKLTSSKTDNIYIGSTIRPLSVRLECHISSYKYNYNFTTACKILEYDDVKIELIELYPCENQFMLESREGYWITTLDCVNQRTPGRKERINKFQYGKIYKLISPQTNNIYVGSTINSLSRRLSNHIYHYKENLYYMTSYELLKYHDVKIVLIETYPTTSKYMLNLRERYWIEKLKSVNKIIPTRTKREYFKLYQQINKITLKIYKRNYYLNNREKSKLQGKIYNQKNQGKIKEYKRLYYINNKETLDKQNKDYYIKNIEKIKKDSKIYRENNRGKIKDYKQQYYINNKEKVNENHKEYYIKNKEKVNRQNNEYNKQKIKCNLCNLELNRNCLARHKRRKHK